MVSVTASDAQPWDADLERSRCAIVERWDWPSPEAGFVAYVAGGGQTPSFPLGSLALAHTDRRRLHEAPVLAAVGFALAVSALDDATQEDWSRGFARLARRDPFPCDRASFVHQPLELLGACVGAMRCRGIAAESLDWLRGVLLRRDAETRSDQVWPRFLGVIASHIVSRPWDRVQPLLLRTVADDDLALLLWLCRAYPALAVAHGLDVGALIAAFRDRYAPGGILPRDTARLVLQWTALRSLGNAAPAPAIALPGGATREPAPRPGGGSTGTRSRLIWLAIATEWVSAHGGLSTFNRELCVAAAKAGHRVFCYVPAATPDESADAARAGVELLATTPTPGLSEEARFALRAPLPTGCTPDVVVGHGRITGPAARIQAEHHFPAAQRIHVLHMAPGAIEWFKDRAPERDIAATAEAREQLEIEIATTANLVVAVGPLLQREFARLLHPHGITVRELLPGLVVEQRAATPPPGAQCLVLGRAEDVELKGLDIAARAVARAGTNRPELRPMLMVRGAPPGTGDGLREELLRLTGDPSVDIRIRNFTADATRIAEDLRQSAVVLMPSRSEGFGLVGLEAIAHGVPTLVSAQSGLGELIEREAPDLAPHHVVPVTKDAERDGAAWAKRVETVLSDLTAAYARANRLRDALRATLSWETSVAALVDHLGRVVRSDEASDGHEQDRAETAPPECLPRRAGRQAHH
jgi:glycosyltransferase involved in cell wall biosynthesis